MRQSGELAARRWSAEDTRVLTHPPSKPACCLGFRRGAPAAPPTPHNLRRLPQALSPGAGFLTYSPRPGTPATHLADDVPADVKRRRLNDLLALQEGIGLARNQAWLGRAVEVLVDAVTPPRSHEHDDGVSTDDGASASTDVRSLAGRTRGNKLVHLVGDPSLLGSRVSVRIDHAGPYALRGSLVAAD